MAVMNRLTHAHWLVLDIDPAFLINKETRNQLQAILLADVCWTELMPL